MTTALLHSHLRRDVELVAAVNAGLWIGAGVLVLVVPFVAGGADGGRPAAGAVLLGLVLVALGAALAAASRRPLDRRAVVAIAALDGLQAVGLLLAPFALRLALGTLAWLAAGLGFFLLATGATAWFFVQDRIGDADGRRRRQSVPEAPSSSS